MSNLDEFLEKRVQEMSERAREEQTRWENHVAQLEKALDTLANSKHESLRRFRKEHLTVLGGVDRNSVQIYSSRSRKSPILALFRGKVPSSVTDNICCACLLIDSERVKGDAGEKVLEALLIEAQTLNYIP